MANMSGHSKWSTIKHKKALNDAKKGKVFSLKNIKTNEIKTFSSGTLARLFLNLPKTRFYTYAKNNKVYNDWLIFYSSEV